MYRIISGNNTGKTRKLLLECAEHNGVFVCSHPERVPERCEAYGIPVVQAIGYDEWYKVARMEPDKCIDNAKDVYIDEIGKFVREFIPYLKGYTLTVD